VVVVRLERDPVGGGDRRTPPGQCQQQIVMVCDYDAGTLAGERDVWIAGRGGVVDQADDVVQI
jgi:hypothetical protein